MADIHKMLVFWRFLHRATS